MAFDFKKAYKEFYLPPKNPEIIQIPEMNFIAVSGQGDPNDADGEYAQAIGLLYGVAMTLKMSPKKGYVIDDYFEYMVPPLEGFWWMEGSEGMNYGTKEKFRWISVIRLPDFIKKADVEWAKDLAAMKKKKDFSKVELMTYHEGICVQCMHLGPFDTEPETVDRMEAYAASQGYCIDINEKRYHHEI